MTDTTIGTRYVELDRRGILQQRSREAWERLEECTLCPQKCGVNRLAGEHGVCRTGEHAIVASYGPHFGEEAPLAGSRGSGTIFFSYCNLTCEYCQNYELSQQGEGHAVSPEQLAGFMIELQDQGCHNMNLVSPSHVVPQFLKALSIAVQQELTVPIVYNTGGYDSTDTLAVLDGIVDIYMPDMKYDDTAVAYRYSKAANYPATNRSAVREMFRQVGDLVTDKHGIAQRGLLVRHLVLPEDLAGTSGIVEFIAGEISEDTYINIMDQYRPCFHAHSLPPLNRRITHQEYKSAVETAHQAGLHRFDERRAHGLGL